MIDLIVAIDANRGIGKAGKLAWYVPLDLNHFKEFTLGRKIVMGYPTYCSLPVQPLPKRKNIVLSRKAFSLSGCTVYSSVSELITSEGRDFVVCGGAIIYELLLPYVDRVVLTRLKGVYECDAFFTDFETDFHLVSIKECHCEESGEEFTIEVWVRNSEKCSLPS
ncbi:dihydrofolate reductase [Vibrio sp. D431a]|uniref:dihydrofolate reductase n=1 Tax=Vibrio sp. D431a TaxID=2837388 RepID=UPI0025523DB3|nr:dihydrofolate reductase [Vibrio sp. D431a]MDK9793884.1 dihydrofolate reductase [Vibrio sp. D431a]